MKATITEKSGDENEEHHKKMKFSNVQQHTTNLIFSAKQQKRHEKPSYCPHQNIKKNPATGRVNSVFNKNATSDIKIKFCAPFQQNKKNSYCVRQNKIRFPPCTSL